MKVNLYFMQVRDINGGLHEIKTDDRDKIINFVKRNRGLIGGFNIGSRKVPESRLRHCIENVSIENLMTLKKEE